jgi:hypothetical protein
VARVFTKLQRTRQFEASPAMSHRSAHALNQIQSCVATVFQLTNLCVLFVIGEKPYHCDFHECTDQFARRSHLLQHIRSKHDGSIQTRIDTSPNGQHATAHITGFNGYSKIMVSLSHFISCEHEQVFCSVSPMCLFVCLLTACYTTSSSILCGLWSCAQTVSSQANVKASTRLTYCTD